MSTEEHSVADLIHVIQHLQNLIEGCIERYMKKSESKHDLLVHHDFDPDLTEIIWNRLENGNKEFFLAYYARLVLIEQIEKFNILLQQQVLHMQTMTLSEVPALMNTYGPSDLIGQQASPPSAPERQNEPLKAEDMQKLHVGHYFGSSIQPSPQGCFNAPFCETRNTETHYVTVAADAPRKTELLRRVNMLQRSMTHEFGSLIMPSTLRMGNVPYLAPQCPISYGAGPSNPGYFQENVFMSGYDPNFRSCQYLVNPQNKDATMTQTGRSVIPAEAGYGASLACNPGSNGCFVELSALTGGASIRSSSSYATDPTNLHEGYFEEMEDKNLESTSMRQVCLGASDD